MDVYSEVGSILLKKFFYNREVYAKQVQALDGKVVYNTTYSSIDANKIRYMLLNKMSIMTYQQNLNKLRWLCFDFDIKSKVLDESYRFEDDKIYKNKLFSEVEVLCQFLKNKNINYLIEYSGNRGIHVWVFLNREISKELGYQIVNNIYENVNFKYIKKSEDEIALDLFPKTGTSKNNKIGLGVKIPLSYHLKSNHYSYCIENINEIRNISELNNEIMQNQLLLLINSKENDIKTLVDNLELKDIEEIVEYQPYVASMVENQSFRETLEQLKRCSIYRYILEKQIRDLTELDRTVLAGTLIRLRTNENDNYGIDCLIEYFSGDIEIYNEELTKSKLLMLGNLYPPNIKFLEKKYNMTCEYSKSNQIENAIHLLDNVDIKVINLDEKILEWIIKSEKAYLALNDEVPLNFIYDEINNLNYKNLLQDINKIKIGEYPKLESYRFVRNEEEKKRTLYSLSGKDRVLTSFIMKEINKMLYGMSSNSSYSYRLNNDMRVSDIFISWNKLWLKYIKAIQDKIYSKSYDEYYIIKLDLKGFYDNIEIEQLREILYSKPKELMEIAISNIPDSKMKEYKNMCEYLLNVTTQINMKGVPQGPAYARYLAEIYLAQVDNFIVSFLDDEFEYYFRYVDDMVILIQDEIRAKEIRKKISDKIGELGLEFNEKCLFGKVSEYKYDIINQDITKYFIDGINENTPQIIVDKAIEMVNDMLKKSKEEFDVKQLPFYLTHLIDEQYLCLKKDEIIEYIISTDVGRGSMFKHFYKNVFFKYYDESKKYYSQISGLSRGNFLNELSKHLDAISNEHIKEIIDFYNKEELNTYELKELYRIILLSGVECEFNLNLDTVFINFINIVSNTKSIKWNSKLLENFLSRLQRYNDVTQIIKILNNILENSKSINNNEILINTIYSITKYRWDEFDKSSLQYLYNFTAVMTLFLDNESKLKDIWKRLIDKFDGYQYDIKYNDWYKYDSNILRQDIRDDVLVCFLMSTFNEIGMNNEIGVTNIEKECAFYFIIYLFDMKSSKISDIRKILEERKLKFLLWCLEPEVRYFPSEKVALKNIYLNNRILLQKVNKLMIRSTTDVINNTVGKSNYKTEIEEEIWYKDEKYSYAILDLEDELLDFKQKLEYLNYFEAINFTVSIKNTAQFRNKYVNIFERGAFTRKNKEIYINVSKFDKALVIDKDKYIINNESNFLKQLLDTLCDAVIEDKVYDLGRTYKISNFKIDFVPSVIVKAYEQMSYVEKLDEEITKGIERYGEDIYSIELGKLQAIGKFLINEKVTNYSKEIQLLKYYNSLYKNDFEKFILYGNVEIKQDNLYELIKTIQNSIGKNMNYDEINYVNKYFEDEVKAILNIIGKEDIEALMEIENIKIERDITNSLSIKINGSKYKINELNYYEVASTNLFRRFEERDIFELINYQYTYKFENTIFKIPDVIIRILEIIDNKSGQFDKENYEINTSISNCQYYGEAVEVIKNQSDVDEYEAKRRIGKFLEHVEQKYFHVVLKVISRYKYMSEEELINFKEEIINKINTENTCIFPLKKLNDDNGLHQIILGKFKEEFDRNSINLRRFKDDYNLINTDKKIDQLVIVNDIAISGSQFKKNLTKLLNGEKAQNIQSVKKDELKKLIDKKVKIVLINCIYTDVFEEQVKDFLKTYNYSQDDIEFMGTKINYNDYLFKKVIENNKDRRLFQEFVRKYYNSFNEKIVGISFMDYFENIENDDTRNILVARYKSMPKFHILVFSYKTNIFKYRIDK
ncbi:hypothetical protein D2A34_10210 [Clostridium chromiireducens]|uniref:Reverse transcriptase domain-containing protein n=1 Tax=Clostridium chromiireducens TaxID=225345 RepID=A0A399IRC6_9CLOT|nr:RNA-directed DNA polymerase [Clostridium chromiireducens]RII35540.1 hypothetical protein D2A34_10210 [Clostridium chromiireducens]